MNRYGSTDAGNGKGQWYGRKHKYKMGPYGKGLNLSEA